jgi:hypothetical protein
LALILVVITESLTKVMGLVPSELGSAAWTATGASKVPMMKQVVASLIFMVCPFFKAVESTNDPVILETYLFAGAHRTGMQLRSSS